jgi:glycosyltransferase involved in cell wall biosynthesis
MPPCRIAVVSPFIDKRHGTERRVAECISRLADQYEFHVYSNRVEDVELSTIVWHRIPALPGPHLLGYLWWFAANHLWRWWDRRFRGLAPEVVYSPGINCLDADAVSVHVLFAQLRRQMRTELGLRRNPIATWPQLIHRRLYYRLIEMLEGRVYPRGDLTLAVVSQKVAADLAKFYRRTNHLRLVYGGLDLGRFRPEGRARLREQARRALGLAGETFVLLLIGNDWKNKGLPCLLEAVGRLGKPNLSVLVVGRDNPAPFQETIHRCALEKQVFFLPPRADVEFYYAAADAYVGPSLEDAFAQPPAEAMACGLPVITSRNNGGSEIISHGVDGLILEQPTDAEALAQLLRALIGDPDLRRRLGENAARTAQQYTWEHNAAEMKALFEQARSRKQWS